MLNTSIFTVLYMIAFIAQLSAWSALNHVYTSRNIAAGVRMNKSYDILSNYILKRQKFNDSVESHKMAGFHLLTNVYIKSSTNTATDITVKIILLRRSLQSLIHWRTLLGLTSSTWNGEAAVTRTEGKHRYSKQYQVPEEHLRQSYYIRVVAIVHSTTDDGHKVVKRSMGRS